MDCVLCGSLFRREGDGCPRILECGHTFCTKCITSLLFSRLPCPHCCSSVIVGVSEGGAENQQLPAKNVALIEIIKIQQEAERSSHGSAFPTAEGTDDRHQHAVCQLCEDQHSATHWCRSCQEFMCSSLAISHLKSRATKAHVVVGVEEAPVSASALPLGLSTGCEDHNSSPFVAYDVQCSRLVCGACTSVGTHSGHACKEVNQVVDEFRRELQGLVVEGAATVTKLKAQMESLESSKAKTDDIKTAAHAQIRYLFAQLREELQVHEEALVAQVDQAVKQRRFELHNRQQCIGNVIACCEHSVALGQAAVGSMTGGPAELVATRHEVRAVVQQSSCSGNRGLFPSSMPPVQSPTPSSPTSPKRSNNPSNPDTSPGLMIDADGWDVQVEVVEESVRNIKQLMSSLVLVHILNEVNKDDHEAAMGDAMASDTQQRPPARNRAHTTAFLLDPDRGAAERPEKASIISILTEMRGSPWQQIAQRITQISNGYSMLELDLDRSNLVDDDGARALGEVLCNNTTLRKLYLRGNRITYKGAAALAQALLTNRYLQKMWLAKNQILDQGAAALAQALRSNRCLKELDLGENQISDDGARELAHALQHNPSLTHLWLYGNPIGDSGGRELLNALTNNRTLTTLDLDDTKVSKNIQRGIQRALKK